MLPSLLPFQPPEQLQGLWWDVLLFMSWSWEAEGMVLSKQEMCYCAATRTPGPQCSHSVPPGFTSPCHKSVVEQPGICSLISCFYPFSLSLSTGAEGCQQQC